MSSREDALTGLVTIWLVFQVLSGKTKQAIDKPRSLPAPRKGSEPDRNMSPQDQADRLPISTPESVTFQRGKAYRCEGDLESTSPIDVQQVKRLMQGAGARDVTIGERPPHRATWNMTAPIDFTLRLGAPLPFQLGGVTIRLRSAEPIAGSGVVVGRKRR